MPHFVVVPGILLVGLTAGGVKAACCRYACTGFLGWITGISALSADIRAGIIQSELLAIFRMLKQRGKNRLALEAGMWVIGGAGPGILCIYPIVRRRAREAGQGDCHSQGLVYDTGSGELKHLDLRP